MKKLIVCTLIVTLAAGCFLLSGCGRNYMTTTAMRKSEVKEKKYVKAEGTIISTERKVISGSKTGEVKLSVKVGQEVLKC